MRSKPQQVHLPRPVRSMWPAGSRAAATPAVGFEYGMGTILANLFSRGYFCYFASEQCHLSQKVYLSQNEKMNYLE